MSNCHYDRVCWTQEIKIIFLQIITYVKPLKSDTTLRCSYVILLCSLTRGLSINLNTRFTNKSFLPLSTTAGFVIPSLTLMTFQPIIGKIFVTSVMLEAVHSLQYSLPFSLAPTFPSLLLSTGRCFLRTGLSAAF